MRFGDEHIDRLVDIVREANETEVLPRFHGLSAGDISTKNGAIDVVTEADTRAEVFITDALKKLYPDALVFGEEAYSADPRVADGLGEGELAFAVQRHLQHAGERGAVRREADGLVEELCEALVQRQVEEELDGKRRL